MPIFFHKNITENTRLAIWEISEKEDFFRPKVWIHRDINHGHKKLQHLAGRYLLPFLFADFPHHEIEIADTRKPFLPGEQYHFSISHCGSFAAAIVSKEKRVGVDVELITPRLHKIKGKFLHPEELRFVNSQPLQQQLLILSILWSAKEAMYKWYGAGEVDFSEMMRTMPFSIETEGAISAAFFKHDFQQQLLLNYKIFDNLTLVWVASEID